MHVFRRFVIILLVTLLIIGGFSNIVRVQAEPPQINIQAMINGALASGSGVVDIPTGVYYLDKSLIIANTSNLIIDGHGSQFIVTQLANPVAKNGQAIIVQRAKAVTLRNFVIDYDPLPFTQGVVIAVGPRGSWYDVEIDPGYRTDVDFFHNDALTGQLSLHTFNARTNQLKPDTAKVYPTRITSPSLGIFRFWVEKIPNANWYNIAVGDVVATGSSFRSVAIVIVHSEGTIVENVSIWSSSGAGIIDLGGAGGSDIKAYITPGPKPAGATRNRLLSATRGGYHSASMHKGATIHDSLIENTGDDAISAFAYIFGIAAVDQINGVIALQTPSPDGKNYTQPGDVVLILDKTTLKIKKYTTIAPGSENDSLVMKLADTTGIKVGDLVTTPDSACAGLVVRNNTIRQINARGLLVKSPGTLIENNHIEATSNASIALGPETRTFFEGPYPTEIIIRGNTLTDTGIGKTHRGKQWGSNGAISIAINVSDPFLLAGNREQRTILIENNTILRTSAWGLVLSNASQVIVRNNQFIQTNFMAPLFAGDVWSIKPYAAILVRESDHVLFVDNTVSQLGQYASSGIQVDSTADFSTIDTRGIKLIQ